MSLKSQPPLQPQRTVLFMGSARVGKSSLCGYILLDHKPNTISRHCKRIKELFNEDREEAVFGCYGKKSLHCREEQSLRIAIHSYYSPEIRMINDNCTPTTANHINMNEWEVNEGLTFLYVSSKKKKINCFVSACFLADIGVLVVDVSNTGSSFEQDFNSEESTMKHQLQIAQACGMENIIVCLNKCDCEEKSTTDQCNRVSTCDISSLCESYHQVTATIQHYLKQMNWKQSNIFFIPTSGTKGYNVTARHEPYSFYEGPSLLEAIKEMAVKREVESILEKQPFRFSVYNCHRIGGVGPVVTGKVESGMVKKADVLLTHVSSHEVKSIEIAYHQVEHASAGDFCSLCLRNTCHSVMKFWRFLCNSRTELEDFDSFEAIIRVLYTPNQQVRAGFGCDLHFAINHCSCKLDDIISLLDDDMNDHLLSNSNKKIISKFPEGIRAAQIAQVRIRTFRSNFNKLIALPLKTFSDCPQLSRILLVDQAKRLLAFGYVTHLNRKARKNLEQQEDVIY
ncbi:hypothetical protein C9374_011189 [Naegleria lovaniensis]|uniref:Tr-type G domain-containing protein n=1 Tax=Naegleria lovaniensis TaxID=51637 RepID=A0AA88GER5_NAELO|nr:uncharacterized protein C9374_011189 [Naegleria lovaniensis]KAG2374110.1 hypothetical protein C9374_011189 [Naegleria lovaniensis]